MSDIYELAVLGVIGLALSAMHHAEWYGFVGGCIAAANIVIACAFYREHVRREREWQAKLNAALARLDESE